MIKKWLDSVEKQKRRSIVCDKQTDTHTDRQTESTSKNNRLPGEARRSMNVCEPVSPLTDENSQPPCARVDSIIRAFKGKSCLFPAFRTHAYRIDQVRIETLIRLQNS